MWNVSTTSAALVVTNAREATSSRELVVDHVEDLHVGGIGQGPVGGVGLPALVGQLRLEALPRAGRALVGLGGDEAPPGQHPPDGGHRRHRGLSASVPAQQVVVDRGRSGVEAVVGERLAQGDDLVLHGHRDLGRRGPGPARLGLEALLALGPVTGQQLVQPTAGHPVGGSDLRHAATLHQDCIDDVASEIHAHTSMVCPLCLATGVRDVLNSDTTPSADAPRFRPRHPPRRSFLIGCPAEYVVDPRGRDSIEIAVGH